MILILTSEEDFTSKRIIDWLDYLGADYIRFSSGSDLKLLKIEIINNNVEILMRINCKLVYMSQVNIFWYRRSHFVPKYEIFEQSMNAEFKKQLVNESQVLNSFVLDYLKRKCINHPDNNYINKLSVLTAAVKHNLKIPNSCVVTEKDALIDFYNFHNKSIITKNITQGVFINLKNSFVPSLTIPITDIIINNLPPTFFPTLLQENIDKSFELRIFYIDGNFYSSAIFSQNDEMTKHDFRNYNIQKPNRVLPYKLEPLYEAKLEGLIKELKLESCSIDILVDNNGVYYLLEINPIGQFAQVSNPCNYNLEFVFANYLLKKDIDVRN